MPRGICTRGHLSGFEVASKSAEARHHLSQLGAASGVCGMVSVPPWAVGEWVFDRTVSTAKEQVVVRAYTFIERLFARIRGYLAAG